MERIQFVYLHLHNVPGTSICDMLGLGKNRYRAYKKWLQEVLADMNQHINVKLGGAGKSAVEIDATYTGGKNTMKKGWGGDSHRGALRFKKHGLVVVRSLDCHKCDALPVFVDSDSTASEPPNDCGEYGAE
jgi:hypothetical protein